jgi:protein ImuB
LLARFGPLLLERFDQALGLAAEALVARSPPPEWRFEWLLEHPTGRREMIEWAVEQLISQACQALARERRGALRLECRFVPEQGASQSFVVGLYRPSASERHVGELVKLKLEPLRFRDPLISIALQVLALDELDFRQQEFLAGEEGRDAPRELAALVDRLSNRLGREAVSRPWLLASAQPEFTCQYRPVSSLRRRRGSRSTSSRSALAKRGKQQAKRTTANPPDDSALSPVLVGDRPLHLEPRPQPLEAISVAPDGPPISFRYQGGDERIARVWGPERIETGWWRSRCVRRDYYQVETEAGDRYWLFRELSSGRWFLHGVFM